MNAASISTLSINWRGTPLQAGTLALYNRQYLAAEPLLLNALETAKTEDQRTQIHLLLGSLYAALLDDAQAEFYFAQARPRLPEATVTVLPLIQFLIRTGRFNEAEVSLTQCIHDANKADRPAFDSLRLRLYIYQKKYADALELCDEKIAQHAEDSVFSEMQSYLKYLLTGHLGFAIQVGTAYKFVFPIRATALDEEQSVVAKTIFEHPLSVLLRQWVPAHAVCLENEPALGIFSALLGVEKKIEWIPLDARPAALPILEWVVKKNNMISRLDWMQSNCLGDGLQSVRIYPSAPLSENTRPDVSGTLRTTELDSLDLPQLNCILNHNAHLAEACIFGARETLQRDHPRLIQKVFYPRLNAFKNQLEPLGYKMVAGNYTPDGEALYCVCDPIRGNFTA